MINTNKKEDHIKTHVFELVREENDVTLTVFTTFCINPGQKRTSITDTEFILQGENTFSSFHLLSSKLTPTKLREMADHLEEEMNKLNILE